MVIRILDHVRSASTYDDGQVIYELIAPKLSAGEPVTVSFEGIGSVPSAFINGAFVRLLESLSFEDVRARLRVVNSTRYINELMRSRFEFVADAKNQANPLVREGIYRIKFEGNGQAGEGMVVIKGNTVNGGDRGYVFTGRIFATLDGVIADLRVQQHNPSTTSIFGTLTAFNLTLSGQANPRTGSFDVSGAVKDSPQHKIRIVGQLVSSVTG